MIASFLERTLPAVILAVAAVGAPVMILSAEGLPRLRSLERELAQVNRENSEQKRQIEFLRKGVQNLKDNPDSVERIARDELGLTRKNEVVFQFPVAKGGQLTGPSWYTEAPLSVDLTRRLLALGLAQREEVQRALFLHVTRHVSLAKLLRETGAVPPQTLDDELARSDAPFIRSVAPVSRLVEALPAGLCQALLALPVRQDVLTRTVDVATFDVHDRHVEREFAFHLKAPIRLIRAPLAALEEALRRIDQLDTPPDPPPRPILDRAARRTPPYIHRSQLEAAAASSVPQLRAPSERPIPLVRRASDGTSIPAEPLRSSTQRPPGPFSMGAPRGPFPDPGPLFDAMRRAGSRDEIIDLLLNGLAMIAGRVGTFVVRKNEYQGWRCNEALAHVEAFREVRIAADVPSILATATATGFYLGPLPPNAVHAELLGVMGGISSEVAVSPLRVEGRLAMLMFLDDLGDSMLATRRAEDLGRVAGESLGRLVRPP